MDLGKHSSARHFSVLVLLLGSFWHLASGQQVIQRGAFGKPVQVMDETNQWTTPLLVASDKDVEIYIPDLSSPEWLKLNYRDFYDHGYYTLSIFTFYMTPVACRQNQIAWGLGDEAHLQACINIGYRIRTGKIDPHQKSVTLLKAAMILDNGDLDPATVETPDAFRLWNQLDANTQAAIEKANAEIAVQMKIYDEKQQSLR